MIGAILGPIVGFFFKRQVLVPALILAVFGLWGKHIETRRTALRAEGAQQCVAERLLEAAEARASLLEARASSATAMIQAETMSHEITRRQLEEMKANAAKLENEIEPYREMARNADSNCLSPSVRELVERQPGGRGTFGGARGSEGGAGAKGLSPPR